MSIEEQGLIKCHFTLEELLYFNELIVRENQMDRWIREHLSGLETLGVVLPFVKPPNIFGKLHSYIQKGSRDA